MAEIAIAVAKLFSEDAVQHRAFGRNDDAFEAGADYFLDKSKDFATIPRLIGELLNRREN